MKLVENQKSKALEEFRPSRVLSHQRSMKHVRVCEDDRRVIPQFAAKRRRRISVIDARNAVGYPGGFQQTVETSELILAKSFRWKDQQGAFVAPRCQTPNYWQRVTKSFSRSSSGCHEDILTIENTLNCFGLMAVQALNSGSFEDLTR